MTAPRTTLPRASGPAVGLEFAEALSGYISVMDPRKPETSTVATYEAAASDGRQAGSPIRYELTVRTRDCRSLVQNPRHTAQLDGFVEAPVVAAGRLRVTHGTLECLVLDESHTGTRNLIYRITLRSSAGVGYFLEGFKIVHDGSPLRLWHETNTLYVTLRKGPNATGHVLAQGVMHRGVADFVRGLVTMRALHASSSLEGIKAIWRFESFFATTLFMTYGGVLAPTTASAPTVRSRPPIRPQEQSVDSFRARDGVKLRLTRLTPPKSGSKGPVMLVHGLGASSRTFNTDTIRTNLAEYLSERGYDVWLLDYRASVLLSAALDPFTADTVATNDWPAAVDRVMTLAEVESIKVVAHCFGATTFFMAKLAGHIPGVESAVCSQNGCHVVSPALTWIKARLHLERLVKGYLPTTLATKQERWKLRLLDDALRLVPVPADEVCHSEVCHRATALFGLLYDHANLTAATHDRLGDLFGEANSSALAHLAMMVRAKKLVTDKGKDEYMDKVTKLAIPISLIHGANNRCYLPKSTELTLEWMVRNNGPRFYDRKLFPGYGHIDSIFGRDAATDVYPYILARLEFRP